MNRLYEIAEDYCGHGFNYDWGAEGEAGVMTPLCREFYKTLLSEVPCSLRFVYGRGWLEGHAEEKVIAVGESTVDSSGTVLRKFPVFSERIIVLGTAHVRGGETISELDTTNPGDREHCVGHKRLDRIEIRFAKPYRKPIHAALHNSTERVSSDDSSLNKALPQGLVGSSSDLHKFSGDFSIRDVDSQDLLGHDTGSDEDESHSP